MIKNSELLQPAFRLLWKYSQNDKRLLFKSLSSNKTLWVETGTYVGHTTKFLAEFNAGVISIEPMKRFIFRARKRVASNNNVLIVEGTSEGVLINVLATLEKSNIFPNLVHEKNLKINFFLDGHNSGLGTYKGQRISPIEIELLSIFEYTNKLNVEAICIDDWRLFGSEKDGEVADYPSKSRIVNLLESKNFSGKEIHDVYVAVRTS